MKTCKFSIITVCYDAQECIGDTIRSVLSQSYDDFEYIIKDGQSGDSTMEIVHSLTNTDNRVMIIQGKDRGIYDAMNIAVLQAKGQYILFLNAGDKFADQEVLARVCEYTDEHKADICYGDIIEVAGEKSYRSYTEKNCKLWYYSLGACLCHQAMFCKKELFSDKLFDLTYQVCADREWQLYHIRKGATAGAMKFPVAEVLTEGFSMNHVEELERETELCVKTYCGKWYLLYEMIRICKKNKLIHKIIQRLEKMVSNH